MECSGKLDGQICGLVLTPDMDKCTGCRACGTSVEGGENSCACCRKELNTDRSLVEEQQMICRGKNTDGQPCGNLFLPSDLFCPICHTPAEEPSYKSPPQIECQGKKEDGTLCRQLLKPNFKFCPSCGSKVDIPHQHDPARETGTQFLKFSDTESKMNSKRTAQECEAANESTPPVMKKTKSGDLNNEEDKTTFQTQGAAAFIDTAQECEAANESTPPVMKKTKSGDLNNEEDKTTFQTQGAAAFIDTAQECEAANELTPPVMKKTKSGDLNNEEDKTTFQTQGAAAFIDTSGPHSVQNEDIIDQKKSKRQKKNEKKKQKKAMKKMKLENDKTNQKQKNNEKKVKEYKGQKEGQEHDNHKTNKNNESAYCQEQSAKCSDTLLHASANDCEDKERKRQEDPQEQQLDDSRLGKNGRKSQPLFAQYADDKSSNKERSSQISREISIKKMASEESFGNADINSEMNLVTPVNPSKAAVMLLPQGDSICFKDSELSSMHEEPAHTSDINANRPSTSAGATKQQQTSSTKKEKQKQKKKDKSASSTKESSSQRNDLSGSSGSSLKEGSEKQLTEKDEGISHTDTLKKHPEEKSEGNKNRLQGAETRSSAVTKDYVTVVFHVIISEAFSLDTEKDAVLIRGQPDVLHAWKTSGNQHAMTYERSTDIGWLYSGKVRMRKEDRNRGFPYKYLVKKHGDKSLWEMVQKREQGKKQELVNRWFKLHGDNLGSTGMYEDEFQCLLEHLVKPLLNALSRKTPQALSLAMFVAILVRQWRITIDAQSISILCHAMLPSQNMERRTCPDLDALCKSFPKRMKENQKYLGETVEFLIKQSFKGYSVDSSWLYCVPLLHFLKDGIKPFQDLNLSATFWDDEWWGIKHFIAEKEIFKNSFIGKKFPSDVIEHLKPNLQADPLLSRTLVACLDFPNVMFVLQSVQIPLDVIAATLIHHINHERYIFKPEKESLAGLMKNVCAQLEKNLVSQESVHGPRNAKCLAELLCMLHHTVFFQEKHHFKEELLLDTTLAVFLILNQVSILAEKSQGDDPTTEFNSEISAVVKDVCEWMHRCQSLRTNQERLRLHLQRWAMLIGAADKILCITLQQRVKEDISKNFQEELEKMNYEHKLEVFLKMQDQVVPSFVGLLHTLAMDALGDAFKNESQHLEDQDGCLISLMSTFLERTWQQKVHSEDEVLNFIITWQPMKNYLQKFDNKTKLDTLGPSAVKYIRLAHECIAKTLGLLLDGTIQIGTLQFLKAHKEEFFSCVTAVKGDQAHTEKLLSLREYELRAFTKASEHLVELFKCCSDFLQTDDMQEIERRLRNSHITAVSSLSEVTKVAKPDEVKILNNYRPVVNPWKLPDSIIEVLPQVGRKMSSVIFCKIFSVKAEQMRVKNMSFWEAFQLVWSAVIKEWDLLCTELINGSITLQKIKEVFHTFYSDGCDYRYPNLKKELEDFVAGDNKQWVEERIMQFQCYTKIEQHVQAAKTLLDFKDALNIPERFDDMEKICKLSQNPSLRISDMNQSILELCKSLKDFQPQDIHCLAEFTTPTCTKFVTWLKKTMKGGLKELNVFVDLAFISAGEEPMAIDRVNFLHAAATGYAPLIFTAITDCATLLKQCQIVFKNIKADPQLPTKLRDTARCLHWFKHEEQSRGSVEKTSLSQVGSINECGTFEIGNAEKHGLSLSQVISLHVLGDDESGTTSRRYTYEELKDLQSRLMLVAGQAEKGKVNVDRFINIMDSLVRLGKTYIQLCADGCILFLNWSIRLLCNVKQTVCCSMVFSGQPMLKGCRNPDTHEDVEQFIAGVANFLEYCHAEWLQYVDQKRREYSDLNIFTVEQLVFLQQQLVKVGSDDLSRFVFPMLSLLRAGCNMHHLEQAIEKAIVEIKSRLCTQETKQISQRCSESQSAAVSKPQEKVFVQKLKEAGFPTVLAIKALKEVGSTDEERGLIWCTQHVGDNFESDEDVESNSEEESNPKAEETELPVDEKMQYLFTRQDRIADSTVSWLQDIKTRDNSNVKSLISNLKVLWQNFLKIVSASGSDFLSLEHLGIILKHLAHDDERHFKRSLPPEFKSGSPNLIICPRSEVLNVVTYAYTFQQADDQPPLPQPDEVLLCTEDTSVEEVDIFLRRAFFSKQHKIYCMAYADILDYDVGEKTEKKIQHYSGQSDKNYCLAVICTTENEYKARIVAALEKYRCLTPSLSSTGFVQKFIQLRFKGLLNVGGIQSASVLDPERLCVRVVKSQRSGVGKTLYKQRLVNQLPHKCHLHIPRSDRSNLSVTIPLHTRQVQTQDVAAILLEHTLDTGVVLPRIIHLDISYAVQEGIDHLLYNLLVLGCIKSKEGKVWLRSPMDLYLVETIALKDQQRDKVLVHHILDILPSLTCWSPVESLAIMTEPKKVQGYQVNDRLFDDQEYRSEVFQRPLYYLHCMDTQQQPIAFNSSSNLADKKDCLKTLLRHCGVQNPSWSELRHFVYFLNKQLQDFENSVYCSMATSQDLPGFSLFVLRFLIQMSRDFATRSLKMMEESLSALVRPEESGTDIEQYELRRTWESSPHPYIFFNPDANSMTFLGFSIDPKMFNLMDQQTGQVLVHNIMNAALFHCLILNRVPLTENFDVLPREDRLVRLYRVLGLHDEEIFDDDGSIIDPDDTYELTTDNVKKMLAIYLRFRCNIPVVIMGETGCGKTRLVEFLCALQTPTEQSSTMIKVKVHGGTTGKDIAEKVCLAERQAERNTALAPHRPVYTVLFFDEANTTEAIGVIKEIMCDGTLSGRPITLNHNLKMVAACNPYRRHSDELIKRLENSGLGYHIAVNKTTDKLGRVPMRHLVYRVQPLPQSMLPLVWDFGQLNTCVEELYIHQMVRRFVHEGKLSDLDDHEVNVLCEILIKCQEFMRARQDECSFVSLRDVTRALTVISWFLASAEDDHTLFDILDEELDKAAKNNADDDDDDDEEEEEEEEEEDDYNAEVELQVSDLTKALVLSLAVCYRACLNSKTEFDKHIVEYFLPPFDLNGDKQQQFFTIIDKCQDEFLKNVHLDKNIARNQALKENVFMMVVCIELRIPLFLVGKPGSSKSLAKTVVEDAMQGMSARTDFFRRLKQVKMVSFQCSPLATADGILATFSQCAQFQKGKNTDTFVSVVVLDEVGLAEDSPKMPLKTLHPLLEEGCPGADEDCRKVGFIGISNWALDPAKMNRGILVQRDVPNNQELVETAKGICTTNNEVAQAHVRPLIRDLASAYLKIFGIAKEKREFFGLRDFYSLVKMVYAFAEQSKSRPSRNQLIAAVRRNFGGLDTIDPLQIIKDMFPTSLSPDNTQPDDPECSPAGLMKAALRGDNMGGESRYLLLLTENYGGFTILFDNLLAKEQVVPIFGSSFPKDQEYTQICRNINRIKVCMEMGQTVILLNLENLYESLYDALNQYYAIFGGERYVDLGLGTHRVKCRVHSKFRLIVVAEKQVVYKNFPIPLINRLEKHFLTLNNILTEEQLELTAKLKKWAKQFAERGNHILQNNRSKQTEESVEDVFMGYHQDTAAAIVLKSWEKLSVNKKPEPSEVLQESKKQLLWCATPDAVVRAKQEEWSKIYNEEQQHKDLTQYLQQTLGDSAYTEIMAQVTTHGKLLTEQERKNFCDHLPITSATLLSLQSFDTEQQFRKQLETFFKNQEQGHKLLLVQSDCGEGYENLIKCAQYCLHNMRPANSSQHHVVFIVQLPRVAGACFAGFLGGDWHCLHIDDLRTPDKPTPSLDLLQRSAPSRLLRPEMEMDEENINRQHSDRLMKHEQGLEMTFIQDLLTSCLQAAVALVRDQGTSRATHRISILLKLLVPSNEPEGNQFLTGLCHLISSLMEQKEKTKLEVSNWLFREAAKIESVKKAGTFRQSWRQCLQGKVIPVMAAVIAYLDTNNNLDLLYHDGGDTSDLWVQHLWLKIFVHQDIGHLNYKRMQSMNGKEELEEFVVHYECPCAALFSAKLPFSWILLQFVENALTEVSESLDTVEAFVEKSSICSCIKTVFSDLPVEREKVLELYISDLLHYNFALTDCQHKVCYQSMMAALAQSDLNIPELELGAAFVCLHKTLHCIKSRLHDIIEMSACQPSAIASLVDVNNHLLNVKDEMTQDVALLVLLVENLTPHPSQFEVEEERQKWVNNYNSIVPIITRIISEANTNNNSIPETHGEEMEQWEQRASNGIPQKLPYGRKCIQQLRAISCHWTRASAVKMFLDFTEPLKEKQTKLQEALIKDIKYQLLWTLLGDDANLKTKKTLECVDRFLKHANGQVIKKLLGKIGKCDYCESKMESAPVKLPCSHNMCSSCWRLADNIKKCPQCEENIPGDWRHGDNTDSNARSELDSYQRQISGFLMALVSQLCFARQEPPDPEAVEHIFGYIIHEAKNMTLQTKHMTVVTDLIDPTPVLRSFLLRLLLKHRERDVMPHLEEYFNKSWKLLQQQMASNQRDSSSLLELSLLIMHCVEDLYQEQDAQIKKALGDLNAEEEAVSVCQILHSMQLTLSDTQVDLNLILLLGHLRFILNKCTDIIQTTLGGSCNPCLTAEVRDLLMAIMRLCQHTNNDWPKKFLIKQLCQTFGVQAYLKLASLVKKEKLLDWFAVEETEVQEVSDRYLVCDPHYLAVREGVAELKVSQDQEMSSTKLKQILKNTRLSNHHQELLLLLAVHREVTMTYLHQIPQQSCTNMETVVRTFVQNSGVVQNKVLAQQLYQNQLGAPGSPLCIHKGQDLAEQGLVCFLTHLYIALHQQEQTSPLLLPLTTLIHQPSIMSNSFLPTMPQDNLDEVLKAVGDNPEVYHCPNGHRYLVGGEGECKMPTVEATCNACGAKIGGINHKPAHRNDRDQRHDQTQIGHILGPAPHRAREALPERRLSPVDCAILRFLTHAVLYLGTRNPIQATAIAGMIQPRISISQQEVCLYFWNHLEHDLQVLCRAVGRSPDEVYLLLHYLCHQLTRDNKGARLVGTGLLKSKEERLRWERMFANEFITPVIQKLNDIIKKGNKAIAADDRQGYSTLLQIVHETENMTSGVDNSLKDLASSPAVWRYRPVITVEHFFREFHLQIESQPAAHIKYPATSLFRAESHVLRALHHVPAILKAQHRLMAQLCRRLDRAEAANLKVSDFMKEKESKALDDLLQPFCDAWEIVKERLITYRCLTPMDGLVFLPQEFHNYAITTDSPLAVLLPSTRGPGLCAYVLLYYLLVQHNEFLHNYCKQTKQRYESLPEVEAHAIMEGHLVGYGSEELLPLVLSHCNYSLKLGESTNLEYDFEAFERHLIHSFMQCKSRVKRHDNGLIDLKTMVYTADTTSSQLFKQLRENINQESLSPGERRQIIEDLREDIPDINRSIDNLNITLRFLKAVHAQPGTQLHKFMTETLRMKNSVFSLKAQQLCCLKHIQSLWIVLCHQRASILAAHKQEAFDSDTRLQKELTEGQKKEVKAMCQPMPVERLELLLLHLFECIMLHLSEPVDQEDGINPENFVLRDVLESNLESPLYQVEPVEVRSQLLTSQHLSSFPESLKGCHSKQTWLLCHSQLRAKQKQQC